VKHYMTKTPVSGVHVFFLLFYVCNIVLYVLLFILCVLCVYFLCIVSSHVYGCSLSICVEVYGPLPPDGNSVEVNKYHFHCFTSTDFWAVTAIYCAYP
jgi:hypothetical protein